MNIHQFIATNLSEINSASCLLIGEDHDTSVTLQTLAGCRDLIATANKPIIILCEGLNRITAPRPRLSMFFCSSGFQLEQAYSHEQLSTTLSNSLKKKEVNFLHSILDSAAFVYGLESLKTDPFILLDTIEDKALLYKSAQKLLPFLFREDPQLHKVFTNNNNLDYLKLLLSLRYAKSTQRINVVNEEWANLIKKLTHQHPHALIIACIGACHIPQARHLDTHQVFEPGLLARLNQCSMTTWACMSDKYNETRYYKPYGDGLHLFDPILPLTFDAFQSNSSVTLA